MAVPGAGDQFNLKWNNHLANFLETFVEHQLGETLVDVTLSCEGQYIKTHRLILSACSDYFHSIFRVHKYIQHPIIFLNGVRFVDLKYILHFMYHGEVKVMDKDLPNVLALGENLRIKGLSSVKLRDVPPEEAQPVAKQAPKKLKAKEISLVNFKNPKINIPAIRPKLLPKTTDSPNLAPVIATKHILDYSRHNKSPKLTIPNQVINDQPNLPVIASVTSEAPALDTIEIPESPTHNSESRNGSPLPSTNSTQISKPPHAFMIFANEWRKKLTIEHPEENNKEISVRLGNMWKNLLPETKNIYYREAKRGEEEYKKKYPNYVSASESLKRKAEVLNDNGSKDSSFSLDPLEIVETQEQIAVSDSD